MANLFLPVQAQKFRLAGSGVTSSATSMTLQSMKLPDGSTNIVTADIGALCFGTLEPGTSREEQISFTGITQNSDGTATLTGVTRGIRFVSPFDSVAANKLSHAGGSIFVISNTAGFYDQMDAEDNDESIGGLYTFAQFPVKSGSTTPTSSTEFATKAYVDATATGTTNYDQTIVAGVAGENLTSGKIVYLKSTDGKWYLADSSDTTKSVSVQLGIAQATVLSAATINVLIAGRDKKQSGLTAGTTYYLSTSGGISTSEGTNIRIVGRVPNGSTTDLIVDTSTSSQSFSSAVYEAGENIAALDAVYITSSLTSLTAKLWGAGGGGGNDNGVDRGGGGGGSGAYVAPTISTITAGTYTVTVGAGGVAGGAGGTGGAGHGAGANAPETGGGGGGGSSAFVYTTTYIASGGGGGEGADGGAGAAGAAATTTVGGNGGNTTEFAGGGGGSGTAGSGSTGGTGGTTVTNAGGAGAAGGNPTGGGGGSSGGTTGNGNAGSGGTGGSGSGGAAAGAVGAQGESGGGGSSGAAGGVPGAGGGGANVGGAAGNGGAGRVELIFPTAEAAFYTNTGGTTTTSGSNTIVTFTTSGTFTITPPTPGKIKKASASNTFISNSFIGFAQAAITSGNSGTVIIAGEVSGLSGLSAGRQYYLANTAGTISTTAGTVTRKVGIAATTTKLVLSNIW